MVTKPLLYWVPKVERSNVATQSVPKGERHTTRHFESTFAPVISCHAEKLEIGLDISGRTKNLQCMDTACKGAHLVNLSWKQYSVFYQG